MTSLQNTQVKITHHQKTTHGALLAFMVEPSLDYFKGHFPTAPILAGVVQLDWAVNFGQQYLSLKHHAVKQVEVLKYQLVITPNTQVFLELEQKSEVKFTFKFYSEHGTHSSGRIVLEEN